MVKHCDFSIYWIIGWALVSAKHINSSFTCNFRGCFGVFWFILFLRERERASTSLLSVTWWTKWAGHKPAPCYLHPQSEALWIVLGNMNSKWKKITIIVRIITRCFSSFRIHSCNLSVLLFSCVLRNKSDTNDNSHFFGFQALLTLTVLLIFFPHNHTKMFTCIMKG